MVSPQRTRFPSKASPPLWILFAWSSVAFPLVNQVSARTLWSASSVLDTAAGLFDQGVPSFREQKDPLLESISHHGLEKNASRVLSETFLLPVLTSYLGDNNQLMEYMTAAVVARATNRTLCLSPFFSGPMKHGGLQLRGSFRGSDLSMENRYNIQVLADFVRIAPLARCRQSCRKRLDSIWLLRNVRQQPLGSGSWDTENIKRHDLAWSFVEWTSTTDIRRTFQGFEQERCVALGGIFPGLRWRGAYLASSTFLRPTESIFRGATIVQERAMGTNCSFLAVHWRFEESNCQAHELGLCFTRCRDGTMIDSNLRPAALEWMAELSKRACHPYNTRGVLVTREDLIAAIREKAKRENVHAVYIATDGWMRGSKATFLVEEVVNALRRSGLVVVGLWKIQNLPNYSDGGYFDLSWLHTKVPNLNGRHAISQIEQEICNRADAFLGSSESTWSLSVFHFRLAKRKAKRIRQNLMMTTANGERLGKAKNEAVIEGLLRDEHRAGIQCRYSSFLNGAEVKSQAETNEDEEPDGWLDLEACENRIGKGGHCKLAACI